MSRDFTEVIGVIAEMRHRAETEGCTGRHDGVCCDPDLEIHPEEWCNRCLMGKAAQALTEALPLPQVDLPPDAAKVLRDHAWDLLDTEAPRPSLDPPQAPEEMARRIETLLRDHGMLEGPGMTLSKLIAVQRGLRRILADPSRPRRTNEGLDA